MEEENPADIPKKMNRSNEHHDDNAQGRSSRGTGHPPDQLDQAVMDSLIKRAEAEAVQQYHDEDSDAMKAQVEDKKQVTQKRETKRKGNKMKHQKKSGKPWQNKPDEQWHSI
ncbi:expressed unknown protein [Seminavis robusta]|uniref:Uncharacterized protein n=1 Tax=Seminavis robusta TaxID=568900 RepID=A0A9N8EXC4_9STRA|nr:expressed unknown protein [Seminavis robusta]|eukprot:Sro1978_g308990.1 n/a (112) ;mRNA; r:2853-3264